MEDFFTHEECTVSGVLGFVLRLSQILGLAPLKFKRVREGWHICISPAAYLYGKTIVSLICFIILVALILDFNVERHLSKYFKTGSDTAAYLGTVTFLLLSLLAGAYTGNCRMLCMITSFTQLQKVNTELRKYGPLTPFKTRAVFISSLSSFFAVCVLFGISYCLIFMFFVLANNYCIMNKLLILQVTLILSTAPAYFSHLNNCLKKLLQQIRDQYATYRPVDVTTTVNHLRLLYNTLCGVIHNIDNSNGVVLVQIIPVFLVSLVLTAYNFITDLLAGVLYLYSGALQFTFVTIHLTQMITIIEPCHLIYKQIERTKYLIGQLLLFAPPEHNEVIHELKLFYKQLMSEIIYTPMGIFYLKRTLIFTIVGCTTTYLIIIVEL